MPYSARGIVESLTKLVCNSYSAAMGYLVRAHGNQNAEQFHCTFSNFFLRGKLREAVRFFSDESLGGSYNLKN